MTPTTSALPMKKARFVSETPFSRVWLSGNMFRRSSSTGEGGNAPSRFKHVIQDENGFRRLTPVELERLNMFPDNHTLLNGVSDTKRAFFMGNALVVGVIEKIGKSLLETIEKTK